jgi:hypothetical protein
LHRTRRQSLRSFLLAGELDIVRWHNVAISTSYRRAIHRKAQRASHDPESERELEREGISIGEAEVLSPAQLEAILATEEAEAGPSIGVTVFFADTPVQDRALIEDPLSDYLEANGIAEWIGAGQGSIGERSFFDLRFAVRNPAVALPLIQRKLKELGAGPSTEIRAGDGRVYNL